MQAISLRSAGVEGKINSPLTRVDFWPIVFPMTSSIGIVGAGQFSGVFAKLLLPTPESQTSTSPTSSLSVQRRKPAALGLQERSTASRQCLKATWTRSPCSPSAGCTDPRRCRPCAPASTSTPPCRPPSPGRRSGPGAGGGGDRPGLHERGDELLLPRHALLPGALPPGGLRALRLRRGRVPARHVARLLRGLPALRGRGLEAHRLLPAHALPHPLGR